MLWARGRRMGGLTEQYFGPVPKEISTYVYPTRVGLPPRSATPAGGLPHWRTLWNALHIVFLGLMIWNQDLPCESSGSDLILLKQKMGYATTWFQIWRVLMIRGSTITN